MNNVVTFEVMKGVDNGEGEGRDICSNLVARDESFPLWSKGARR